MKLTGTTRNAVPGAGESQRQSSARRIVTQRFPLPRPSSTDRAANGRAGGVDFGAGGKAANVSLRTRDRPLNRFLRPPHARACDGDIISDLPPRTPFIPYPCRRGTKRNATVSRKYYHCFGVNRLCCSDGAQSARFSVPRRNRIRFSPKSFFFFFFSGRTVISRRVDDGENTRE